MIVRIPAKTRGLTKTDWLTSYHSFSFGDYYDPERVRFGHLRVLNDDTVAPSKGFPPHHHDNMEIVSIVLEGGLEHKDSLGNHGVIGAGQMQRITAGKGIEHAEFNPSPTQRVHFLQIWITPRQRGLEPDYEQRDYASLLKPNQWQLLISPEKKEGAMFIHQDVKFWMAKLESGASLSIPNGYCFIIEGEVQINGTDLKNQDAAMLVGEKQMTLVAKRPSQILLIETGG